MDPTDFFQNTMTEDFNGSNDFFGPNYNTCDSVLNSEKPVEHTEDTAGTLNVQNTQNAQKDESQPELVEQETPLSESGYVAPRNEMAIAKMKDILAFHFDIEIEYKTQKIQEVVETIQKVEAMWFELQALWSQQSYLEEMEAGKNTTEYNLTGNGKKKRRRKSCKVGDLFARRPDGQYVQLICPVCKRRDFATQLGFGNHCRIAHRLKFSTYEDASIYCGVPVDESQVPLDDLSRQNKPLSFFVEEKKQEYKQTAPYLAAMQHINKKRKLTPDSEGEAATNGGINPFYRDIPHESNISRFYIRKQVMVGNTSQYVGDMEEDGGESKKPTHKWMVYVRGPEYEREIHTYISKVRFFLHPSFAPNDIVEVHQPPFQITRSGWGEFPVRIQIHFVDSINKPVNIIHHLKLHEEKSALQILGAEEEVTLELDRASFEREEQKLADFMHSQHQELVPDLKVPDLQMDTEQLHTKTTEEQMLQNHYECQQYQPQQQQQQQQELQQIPMQQLFNPGLNEQNMNMINPEWNPELFPQLACSLLCKLINHSAFWDNTISTRHCN